MADGHLSARCHKPTWRFNQPARNYPPFDALKKKMPRYFFTVESPTHTAVDEQGEELGDDVAAHQLAQQTARELAGTYDNATVVVRAEDGRFVTEVPIECALN